MSRTRMKKVINALFRDLRELRACIDTNGVDRPSHVKRSKHGERGKRRRIAPAQLDLPFDVKTNSATDYMTTTEAAKYCRFLTSGGLRKAWYAKLVFPAGRRGGRNLLIWSKSELDRFLRGEPVPSGADDLLMPPQAAVATANEAREAPAVVKSP